MQASNISQIASERTTYIIEQGDKIRAQTVDLYSDIEKLKPVSISQPIDTYEPSRAQSQSKATYGPF